ncbi:N-acetyl-anhydromuranmyl-L-alanine amidase [Yersinia similis]|nr:N-acetyl-anhydromuranmyl-L-alanine amidase [Yersinia similis]
MLLENGWIVGVKQVLSPHFDQRPEGETPSLLVIHSISLPPSEFGGPYIDQLFTGTLNADEHPYFADIVHLRVSVHCLIRRDGEIIQYIPFDKRPGMQVFQYFLGVSDVTIFLLGSSWKGQMCYRLLPCNIND